jgi:hypothetical protein
VGLADVTKKRGGLYVWRVDKPHALIGLPFIGRHFGYCGMTNSYYFREKQQLYGSEKYGTAAYSWSDLRPKRYKILPLPDSLLKSNHKVRRRLVKALETGLIKITCPVYNDTQQPFWNLRKISKSKAAAQRAARDSLGRGAKVGRAALRYAYWATVITLAVFTWMQFEQGSA